MANSHEEVLQTLTDYQLDHELSIIKLSEPITSAVSQAPGPRTSDASAEALSGPNPASLEADLAHYKELFSKLRFSYLEQVTKEKFIRAIVSEPPLVVEHQENVDLETRLVDVKASLKSKKTEVADLVAQLEVEGRKLSQHYESIQLQTTQLRDLPSQISHLEASIKTLEAAQTPGHNPLQTMSLEKTQALLGEKEQENAELDRQLEQLKSVLPRKTRELERLEAELQPLEVKRLGSTSAASEAQRRKEEALGGAGDDLEERGRWWRGVEGGLKGMLGLEWHGMIGVSSWSEGSG